MNLSLSFLILSATITLIHASFPKLSSIKNVVVHFEYKEFLIDSVLPNNIPGSSSDPDAISLTSAYGSDVPLPRPATFLRSVAWSVSCSFCFCPDPDIFVLFFSVAMVQRRRRSSSGAALSASDKRVNAARVCVWVSRLQIWNTLHLLITFHSLRRNANE